MCGFLKLRATAERGRTATTAEKMIGLEPRFVRNYVFQIETKVNKYKDKSNNLLDLTTNVPLCEAVCRTAPEIPGL